MSAPIYERVYEAYGKPMRVSTGDGLGDYYANKRREADHWRDAYRRAQDEGADDSMLRWIRDAYERASYVGD